jgi:hypothetical protein
MIKPTVGRIVHFYEHARAPVSAAIIAHVNEDTVNLTVFSPSGVPQGRVGVPLVQPGQDRPASPASAWCERSAAY